MDEDFVEPLVKRPLDDADERAVGIVGPVDVEAAALQSFKLPGSRMLKTTIEW